MSRREQAFPTLRLACVPEEDRALFVSYGVASLLALTWLMLVHLLPASLDRRILPPDDRVIVVVQPPLDLPLPSVEASADASARRMTTRSGSPGPGSVRDAFSGSAGLVDAGRLLSGVELSPSSMPRGAGGLKVGLRTGVGSRTPGRTSAGGVSPVGTGVGTVGGGGVSRSAVTIAPPEVRAIAPGAFAGNASEVGQTARARVPQLERCYYQEGLSRNAALAGLVRLAITVESGRVTSAQIVDRSWAGAGVAETESCLLQSVRGWRLGTSDARIVLPLSFTSAR
jgi:hypothetical protein